MVIPSTKLLAGLNSSHGTRAESRIRLPDEEPDQEKLLRNSHSVLSKRIFSNNTWSHDYNVPDSGIEGDNPILTSFLSTPNRVGSKPIYSGRVNGAPNHAPIASGRVAIRSVLIYTGHNNNPKCAPYESSITRVQGMFKELNKYRESKHLKNWKIIPLHGEEFMEVLTFSDPTDTLLVFPAGESTHLDNSFTLQEKNEIQNFIFKGGRGYFTCGSGYWIFKTRHWGAPCLNHPNASHSNPIVKTSQIPLIDGEAIGPLCPLPGGMMHGTGFFSKAINVKYGNNRQCTVFLGGGGSFILKDQDRASALKSAILYQLRPSMPLGKRAKKNVDDHPNRNYPSFVDSLPSAMIKEPHTLSTSPIPRKAESLTDLPKGPERINTTSSTQESCPFRKVESLTELNNLEKNWAPLPPKKARVLVRYDFEELKQLGISQGKTTNEVKKLENAAVLARSGKGAVLATTFHPYHNPNEIDVERYEKEFPNSGTNWREMIARLSSIEDRVDLFFNMMESLETFDFDENSGVS